jgi:UDP-glucose 4-epimerase
MADAPVSREVINIGPDSGEITILELAELCASAAGVDDVQIVHYADRPREVRHANCSSRKARRLLGFTQQQSMMDCLREMAAAIEPKPFEYHLPIEIINGSTPRTWRERIF